MTTMTRPLRAPPQVIAPPAPGSAAARVPPASLPGLHFGAALLFLLLGAAGAVLHAPDLAAGRYLSPRVAAVTHLYTLGWITTSIMGALYQFVPVALSRPIRWTRVAYATWLLYVPGVLVFVAGLFTFTPTLLLGGAAALSLGVLLFISNLGMTLKAATRRDVTWWALTLATTYLAVTLVLGLALTGNLRWGYMGASRLSAVGVHLHVALAGWVLLVMIGVGHRLLPMFLLSHGAGDRLAKLAVALVGAGAGVLAVLHHAPRLVSHWLPAVLIACGVVAFLAQARAYYITRHRPALDPGTRLAAAALVLLACALLLAWPIVVGGAAAQVSVAYVLTAVLAITLFIVAHYYRIVPFLVWYHRFGPLAGTRAVPRVSELYSARLATVASAAMASGATVMIAAVALGAGVVARAAAVVLAIGAGLVVMQMFGLWRTKP